MCYFDDEIYPTVRLYMNQFTKIFEKYGKYLWYLWKVRSETLSFFSDSLY